MFLSGFRCISFYILLYHKSTPLMPILPLATRSKYPEESAGMQRQSQKLCFCVLTVMVLKKLARLITGSSHGYFPSARTTRMESPLPMGSSAIMKVGSMIFIQLPIPCQSSSPVRLRPVLFTPIISSSLGISSLLGV